MQLFSLILSIFLVIYATDAFRSHDDIGLAKRQATMLYRRGPKKKSKKDNARPSQRGQASGPARPNPEGATTSGRESRQENAEFRVPAPRRPGTSPESDHQAAQRVQRNVNNIMAQQDLPATHHKPTPPVSSVKLTGGTFGQLSLNSQHGEVKQNYPVDINHIYFGMHAAAPYTKGEILQSKDADHPTQVNAVAVGKSVEALVRVPPGTRARYWKDVPGKHLEDVALTAADNHPISVKAKSETTGNAKLQVSLRGGGSSVEVVGHEKAETAQAQPLQSVPGRDRKYPP